MDKIVIFALFGAIFLLVLCAYWICNKLGYYSRHYQADYNVLFHRVFFARCHWDMVDPVPAEIGFS